jgi:hypothetical protein
MHHALILHCLISEVSCLNSHSFKKLRDLLQISEFREQYFVKKSRKLEIQKNAGICAPWLAIARTQNECMNRLINSFRNSINSVLSTEQKIFAVCPC